jgi:acetolactate synthase I/II/III large subunit
MKITVAQAIVRCLESEQIEYAFGLTGSHLLAFFNALKDSSIRYISVKHEGAAGFMALNYTKVAQKPALLLATAGPGAANLINGVAEMYKCGIPGFILTPVVPINTFGKNALQEDSGYGLSYSVNRLLGAVTKKSALAINGDMVPSLIRDLFRYAFTPPYGPVHISVPVNLFTDEIEFEELHPGQYRAINDCRVEHQKIRKAVGYISEAKKPLVLIGNRCLDRKSVV